jgi:hypothetical protein
MAQITLNSSGVASNGSLLLQSNGTTTAVTIDASQKVGIGVTPTYVLDVQTSSTTSVARVQNTTASSAAISVLHNNSSAGLNSVVYGSTYASGTIFSVGASGAALYTSNAGPFAIGTYGVAQPLSFSTNSVERMTISSAGNVSIAAGANASYNFFTENDNTTTGASQYSIAAIATMSGTTFSSSFLSQLRIAASTTAVSAAGLRIVNPSLASGASITNNYGIYIDDLTTGTNDYGITSLVSSGTNKHNLYISGTAQNYFNGNVGIGTASPATQLHVNGTIRYTNRPAAGTITAIGFDTNGDLKASSSSLRYKHDIEDYGKGLAEVMQLRPVSFKFNGEENTNIGFIAEEVDALGLTEVMLYNEEEQPEGVIYANMVSLLTKAIQEMKAIIDTQASTITSLTDRITALEAK